jgi:type IV pilus assembly protein PilB
MEVNLHIKKMISERKNIEEIKNTAVQNGMITLQQSCKELVINGTTTIEEYIRNTYVID